MTLTNKNAKKSNSTDYLVGDFRENAKAFVAALEAAGATVRIDITTRSKKRAYLFHWPWKIGLEKCKPKDAKAMLGVEILA